MKILIVEDEFTSRKIIQKFLVEYGDCDIAVSGTEAIAAADFAWQENAPYDLITLDIMMPAPDGLAILNIIRERERTRGIAKELHTKIVMTSSLGDRKSIVAAAGEECDAYLIKPIAGEKLHNVLQSLGFSKKTI
jgi:two-component system chemotaxis response regulator CheY